MGARYSAVETARAIVPTQDDLTPACDSSLRAIGLLECQLFYLVPDVADTFGDLSDHCLTSGTRIGVFGLRS
jgi:hypothetical protein